MAAPHSLDRSGSSCSNRRLANASSLWLLLLLLLPLACTYV